MIILTEFFVSPFRQLSTYLLVQPLSNFIYSHPLYSKLQITSTLLFRLKGLKERLEVARTKAVVISPLNHLQKEGRPILERLGEDLQQIAVVIKVN
ncbi:hypothetical protein TYRP_021288 [Tyrophagus putrescentiae]|nr:hypothetical protein TYRP_021288 [Tyrophagus putrescentiae]